MACKFYCEVLRTSSCRLTPSHAYLPSTTVQKKGGKFFNSLGQFLFELSNQQEYNCFSNAQPNFTTKSAKSQLPMSPSPLKMQKILPRTALPTIFIKNPFFFKLIKTQQITNKTSVRPLHNLTFDKPKGQTKCIDFLFDKFYCLLRRHSIFMSDSEHHKEEIQANPCKLYISNLDQTFSNRKIEADLHELFDRFGTVHSINVRRNEKYRKVYAFVLYKAPEEALTAIDNLDGEYFGDIKIKVELQKGRRVETPRIGRMPNSLTCYRCGKPGHFARFCTQKEDVRDRNHARKQPEGKEEKRKHRSRDRKRRSASSSSNSSGSSSYSKRRRHRRNSSNSSSSSSSNK